jgi:DNA-binding SARP family transcriptional activator
LGLLAILAVADESGISRDKLVGLLWPESSPRRARHSLTQALYAARKALECEDLFEGIEDVRLNPLRIRTDVQAFRRALESRDQAAAAALYRGPFLDGLYLSSTEFERWLDSCRASYEERAVAALKTLASGAEAVADYSAAADYLRQLASVRPADPAIALQLMRALSQSGDPAAAIQRADLYAKTLRDDFQLPPDRRVTEFAEELRRSAPQMPASSHSASGSEVWHTRALEVSSDSNDAPVEATAVLYQRGDGVAAAWNRSELRRKATRWRVLSTTVVSCFLIAAVFLISRRGQPAATVEPLQQRIVVAPFRISGADASLHFLREGMVELLSTRLAEDTSARAVDAGAVLRAWRRAGIHRSQDASNDTVARLAARLGAERVICRQCSGDCESSGRERNSHCCAVRRD